MTPQERDLFQQALDALEYYLKVIQRPIETSAAVCAIRAHLANTKEQEPNAWLYSLVSAKGTLDVKASTINWNPEYQPFGREGIDYAEGLCVTKEPLYLGPKGE